jgi:NitT/TauT family transport system substrate-binding protein
LAIAAVSCAPEPSAPPPKELMSSVTMGVGMAPLASLAILADAEGLFAREGVTVSVRKFASGKLALDALLAGEVQVATAAVTPVVFSSFKRRDFSIVASIGSSGNDTHIIGRKDRGIVRPQDLRGRRIATQEASAVHFFLHMFLLKHGLKEKDVAIRGMAPDDFPQALARGEVDACAMREPLISRTLALLGDKAVVFEEPELYVEHYNLLVRNRSLDTRPEMVHHLLRALLAAETFAKNQPRRAMATVARAFAMDEVAVQRLWPCLNLRVRLDQTLLLALEDQARWAMEGHLVEFTAMPNYLQFLRLDAMLSVKPSAASIIR